MQYRLVTYRYCGLLAHTCRSSLSSELQPFQNPRSWPAWWCRLFSSLQVTASSSLKALCYVPIWLSALRQPAHRSAAPKCHTPSPWLPPVLRQSAQRRQLVRAAQAIAQSPCVHLRWFTAWRFPTGGSELGPLQDQVSNEQSAYRRPASRCVLAGRMRVRQNLCNSSQGSAGVPRSNICHQGKVCLFSSAVPSRHSLTFRSMGRLHHCSLRHSHAGAPYLGR